MSESTRIPMSKWEWDNVMDTPERQEAARERLELEEQRRAEREELLCSFYRKNEERRKGRVEIQAVRYTCCALASGVVSFFCGRGGIEWLAWAAGIAGAVLALIAAYGFGKVYEMGRK